MKLDTEADVGRNELTACIALAILALLSAVVLAVNVPLP